jgi:hypothetical protein
VSLEENRKLKIYLFSVISRKLNLTQSGQRNFFDVDSFKVSCTNTGSARHLPPLVRQLLKMKKMTNDALDTKRE